MSVLARAYAHWRGRRYGDYIWTASGKRFWPLDPRAEDVELVDIARGLATSCRYSGQLGLDSGYSFYSVSEHCVIVSIATERHARALGLPEWQVWSWALEALLHDGSEAYIGDVSRPVKYMPEMRAYRRIEQRLDAAIVERFDLHPTPESAREIKIIDSRVLIDEIDAFMRLPDGDDLEQQIAKFGPALGVNIAGLSPPHAEHVFLQRYAEIEANL